MTAIAPIPHPAVLLHEPVAAEDPIPPFVLRRRLMAELNEVREQIARSGLHDEMTQQIADWQGRFEATLRRSADEEGIFRAYVALLQELLCDPVTDAPLDAYAVLGNDGHTYGQMSLAVYRISTPVEFQNRSPLDAGNPRPFTVTPHSVVRHMVGWLQRHNALLYSEELERTYLRLLPQQRPMDRQERIDGIAARQAALDRVEAERRRVHINEFDRDLDARLRAFDQELEQNVAPLRALAEEAIPEQGRDVVAEEVQERLDRVEAQNQHEFARLQARHDGMAPPFRAAQEQVDGVAEEERDAIARLAERIEDHIHIGLEHIAERIDAYSVDALRRINEAEQRDQEAVRQLRGAIRRIHDEIEHLAQGRQELERGQQDVAAQIDEARRETAALQQGIYQTQIAVREMKERSRHSLLSTVAVIGVCVFATWAVAGVMSSSSFGASVLPKAGGAGLKITISM
jgi:hypothetical protein